MPYQPTTQTINLKGNISLDDKRVAAYRMLPFEVPEGIGRLEVRYSFNKDEPGGLFREAGNILDIGLFDERGSEFLTAEGFRGWSGSALREFTVGLYEATPGYLPGPIQAGQWEIILGLHRILPEGCDYRVTITLFSGEDSSQRSIQVPKSRIIRAGANWYCGELHCHTHHSEATGNFDDLRATARAQELDFVAVTEHNTVSHLPEIWEDISNDVLLIPGMEITTDGGHANIWGIDRWLEFRCENSQDVQQVLVEAHRRGALISVNHPKEMGPPWTYGLESEFDCLEVWQLAWFMNNDQSLALWDNLLKEGHRLTVVGGSDYHQEPFSGELGMITLGTPCNWIFAEELSMEGILAGLQAGHAFISENPQGPRVFLEVSTVDQQVIMGDEIVVAPGDQLHLRCHVEGALGMDLCIHSLADMKRIEIEKDPFTYENDIAVPEDTYFRVEIQDPSDASSIRALTNPVYVTLSPVVS